MESRDADQCRLAVCRLALPLAALATTCIWPARVETAGSTVKAGNPAIAVLQLEATRAAAARGRYMALAG